MARIRLVHPDQGILIDELEALRQRPIDKRFVPGNDADLTTFRVLVNVVKGCYLEQWSDDSKRRELVHAELRRAINGLSGERISKTPTSMTWRKAARIMYDLEKLERADLTTLNSYDEPQEYAKLARLVRERCGYPNSDSFKDVNRRMRGELAAHLLSNEIESEPVAEKITDEDAEPSLVPGENEGAVDDGDEQSRTPHETPAVSMHAKKIEMTNTIQGNNSTMFIVESPKK